MNTCITFYKTHTNKVFCKYEYELLLNNKFPTTVAVVGNKSAAQRVVVGLTTELNWTVLVELLTGSHLKINTNAIN